MARYSSRMTAAGAGTSLRPIFAVLSIAAVAPVVREVSLWNTTAVACVYRLVRLTGGTAGATQTAGKYRQAAPAASSVPKGLWTADATIDEDIGEVISLAAQIGAAAIVNFGDTGIEGVVGTTKGIGLIPVGTGQVCEVKFTWDE